MPGSQGSCVDVPRVETAAAPSARSSAAMAYDSARGIVVLFGGYASATSLADTWEHDGTRWVQITPTDPEGDGDPPLREGHAMAFDSVRERVVLFGWLARRTVWRWCRPAPHRIPPV